ncbi:MAG TPA: proton-conducting transporter membrane subunit [Candidatus Sulfomarinibacteraceae bacterium]|nr:proton-conducting transporter membrane subunit [Candidatus Sulfomarinibacteraceae bacterium]
MSASLAVGLAVAWPLLAVVLIALLHRWPNLRETAILLVGGSLFALVAGVILPEVQSGGRPRLDLVEVLPGLELAFEVEPLGMLFALVASGLWIVTTFYSIGYMRGHHETNQTRFYICFAIAISSALGVAFAANVFTLFVFYEAITLSTFPLVTHSGTEQAKRAGRVYLGILMGTSIAFLLLAMVWTWLAAGTTDFRPGGILAGRVEGPELAILLALYAFGTGKAALMPFHRWLPAAMVAPTPVSALLHAVAVVKAGVFTVLKVVVYIFGIDLLAATDASRWLTWVAAFTIIAASTVALTKDNLKARLAYSTVSQLSYIVLGAALATSAGVLGGGVHIVMHAFGKITLFFCAGAILVGAHKTEVSELDGLGRRMPFTFGAFLLGSISVIGLPPTGGAWSKWFLMLGAAEADRWLMMAVLMTSSLLSIAYLMPVVVRGFFRPAPADPHHGNPGGGIHEAPLLCVLPPVATALGGIALFFWADEIWRLLTGMVP